jgi:hypothetical protein
MRMLDFVVSMRRQSNPLISMKIAAGRRTGVANWQQLDSAAVPAVPAPGLPGRRKRLFFRFCRRRGMRVALRLL